jgi:hypothetical protein
LCVKTASENLRMDFSEALVITETGHASDSTSTCQEILPSLVWYSARHDGDSVSGVCWWFSQSHLPGPWYFRQPRL